MEQSTEKKICKICRQVKNRIQNGKYPNGKDKRWVDETGSQWNGAVCPSCQKLKVKQQTKHSRHNPEVKKLIDDAT